MFLQLACAAEGKAEVWRVQEEGAVPEEGVWQAHNWVEGWPHRLAYCPPAEYAD